MIKLQELKIKVAKGNYAEILDLSKELIKRTNYNLRMLLVSFGEHGSIIITRKHAVHVSAPKIELGCSSGAGDSGLANVIVVSKRDRINLKKDLLSPELEMLATAFNYAASATAMLPGNEIAGSEQVEALQKARSVRSSVYTMII